MKALVDHSGGEMLSVLLFASLVVSSPLIDVVRFCPLRIVFSLTILKRVYYEKSLALF